MSYILDALRRAEAQRSRGAVPTLHAPVLDAGQRFRAVAEPARRRWVIWLLLGVAVVAAVLLAWRLSGLRSVPGGDVAQTQPAGGPSTGSTPSVPVASSVSEREALPTAAPQPQPLSPTAAVVAASPPSRPQFGVEAPRSAATPSASESAPSMARRAEPGLAPPRPAPPVVTLRSTEPPPPLSPAQTTNPAAGGMPSPPSLADSAAQPATRRADAAVPARRDLPPEVQRELPPLAVSGMVYSADRAQRMVIVNGELLHEGDRISPELVLEEIRRKDAVLRYKGQRFSISP